MRAHWLIVVWLFAAVPAAAQFGVGEDGCPASYIPDDISIFDDETKYRTACVELKNSLADTGYLIDYLNGIGLGDDASFEQWRAVYAHNGVVMNRIAKASREPGSEDDDWTNRIIDLIGLVEAVGAQFGNPDGVDTVVRAYITDDRREYTWGLGPAMSTADALWGMHDTIRDFVNKPLDLTRQMFFQWTMAIRGFAETLFIIIFVIAFFANGYNVIFGSLEPGEFLKSMAKLTVMAIFFYGLLSPIPGLADAMFSPAVDGSSTLARASTAGTVTGVAGEQPFIAEMAIGLVYWVNNALVDDICESSRGSDIYDSMNCEADTGLSSNTQFDPGIIVTGGIQKAVDILDIATSWPAGGVFERIYHVISVIPKLMLGLGTGFVVMILYLIMALMVMAVWLEGFLIVAMGMFVLAFGAWDHTRSKATEYLWYIVGWAIRMVLMMLVYFIVYSMLLQAMEEWTGAMVGAGEESGQGLVTFLIYCFVQMIAPVVTILLMNSVPNKVSGFVGGGGSEVGKGMAGMAKQVASVGAVGAAGMGASAIAGQAAGVGKTVTGAIGARHEGAAAMFSGGLQGLKQGVAGGAGGILKKAGAGMVGMSGIDGGKGGAKGALGAMFKPGGGGGDSGGGDSGNGGNGIRGPGK